MKHATARLCSVAAQVILELWRCESFDVEKNVYVHSKGYALGQMGTFPLGISVASLFIVRRNLQSF